MGKYPSRLFVLPLAQVIDEYTKTELRRLASVPLNLSRTEIEEVVERAAEMHWSYDGNYFFLSNNCAVESLKWLRGGSNNAQLTGQDSIMPNRLLEVRTRQPKGWNCLEQKPLTGVRLEPCARLRTRLRKGSVRRRSPGREWRHWQCDRSVPNPPLHRPQDARSPPPALACGCRNQC